MIVPGQWERRSSQPTALADAPPPAAEVRAPERPARTRHEMTTRAELWITAVVLLGVMLFAMWASRLGPRALTRLDLCATHPTRV